MTNDNDSSYYAKKSVFMKTQIECVVENERYTWPGDGIRIVCVCVYN